MDVSNVSLGVPSNTKLVIPILVDMVVEKAGLKPGAYAAFAAGSRPLTSSPRDQVTFRTLQELGFETSVSLRRFGHEEAVDERMHNVIFQHLTTLDSAAQCGAAPPGILVLMTGDGNDYSNTCSFPKLVEFAARNGWTVHIFSWARSLSRKFEHVRCMYTDRIHVHKLDDYVSYGIIDEYC